MSFCRKKCCILSHGGYNRKMQPSNFWRWTLDNAVIGTKISNLPNLPLLIFSQQKQCKLNPLLNRSHSWIEIFFGILKFSLHCIKIRQSKINWRSVAGPMGQINRRPSVWCSKYYFFSWFLAEFFAKILSIYLFIFF